MAMNVTCPSCGHSGRVSEAYAGRDVICPKCRERFHTSPLEETTATARSGSETGVVVTCPSCDRSYPISESHLARTIVCLWCQHRFRVKPVAGEAHEHEDEEARIVIACPSCGIRRSTTTAFVGHAVSCPQCRALFVVKASPNAIEVPAATIWPFVLSLGIALLSAGLATSLALSVVGAVFLVFGLGGWIRQLLPGEGHLHEPFVEPALRPQPILAKPGTVDQLRPGMAGYRFQLPEKIHPISAGVKGGILGGLVMPIPTIAYGIVSGHGIWFPINLLAGMVLPGIDEMPVAQLEAFSLANTIVAMFIHVVFSVGFGLLYGVVLPTLPKIPAGPLLWGGLLMPLVWTGASYAVMGVVNPALRENVDWSWFLISQLVYGLVMALVVHWSEQVYIQPVGGPPVGSE